MEEDIKFKRKVTITGGIPDAYKLYKRTHPRSVISKREYIDTCHHFNKLLSNAIIKESREFKIPHRLGSIRIKSFKKPVKVKDGKIVINKYCIDWASTKAMWAEIYGTSDPIELKKIPNKKLAIHTNEHTNGYIMKWNWNKFSRLVNKTVYKFRPVKGGKIDDINYGRKGLAAWILNEDRTNEYFL